MTDYTQEELKEALRAIHSVIHKCEKAQEKFPEGNSHHTLLRNRLKAMYISNELITEKLTEINAAPRPLLPTEEKFNADELLSRLDSLHTTELGAQRIRKNLSLSTSDVVGWCRKQVTDSGAIITRTGKNWYILANGCEITVNAHSCTIITAHLKK